MPRKIRTSTIIDFAQGRLTPAESLGLLESIERDPRASRELDLVVDLMNEASDPQTHLFSGRSFSRGRFLSRPIRTLIDDFRIHPFLYPAGALGFLVLAFVILVGVYRLSANKFDELTSIDRTAFTWNARGTDNSDIAGAYICFTNGQYDKSIALLERYLRREPGGELTPFVHYSAGAVCLIDSRQNPFMLFQTHDEARIAEGLQHLSLALGSTSNRRLLEESRLLRAKGLLMLQKPREAIAELDTARSLNGPRSEEAIQMIERIHALTP